MITGRARQGRWTDPAVLIAWWLAVVGVTAFSFATEFVSPTPREAKFRDADRVILYQVAPGVPSPRFVLARGERGVVLVTHAVYPAETPAAGELSYGLRLRVRDARGSVYFEHVVWTRTRTSRARRVGDTWLDENTFSVEEGRVLGDDRLLDVRLPPEVPADSTLEFAALGVPAVLLRAYRRVRIEERIDPTLADLTGAEVRVLQRISESVPWLREDEARLERERGRWQRLAALGEDGPDYRTEAAYHTGFRLPPDRLEEPEALGVTEDLWLAFNVRGPTRLIIEHAGDPLEGVVFGVGGSRTIPVAGETPIEIPPGAHTLVLRGRTRESAPPSEGSPWAGTIGEPRRATVRVRAPNAEPYVQVGRLSSSEARERLDVDRRRLIVSRLSRGETLGFPIDTRDGSPALRLEVREVAATEAVTRVPQATDRVGVALRFLGARGEELGRTSLDGEVTYAPFERAHLADGSVHAVSEPCSLVVEPPQGTTQLVVEGDGLLVRLLTRVGEEERYEAPYAEALSGELGWRYAPREARRWVVVRPRGVQELMSNGRIARVVAQVRLDRQAPPELPDAERQPARSAQAWHDLEPIEGLTERLLEPRPEAPYVQLETPMELVRVPGEAPRLLVWSLDDGAVGGALEVWVDGHLLHVEPVVAARLDVSLPEIGPGTHRVEVRGPPSSRVAIAGFRGGLRDVSYRMTRAVALGGSARVRVVIPPGCGAIELVSYATAPIGSILIRGDQGEARAYIPGRGGRGAILLDRRGEEIGRPARTVVDLPGRGGSWTLEAPQAPHFWLRVRGCGPANDPDRVTTYRGRWIRGLDAAD